ncbi:hypothetical protein [Kitasatospora indigofera]|uniref:hypothetical protein n=1 Tax=Kitasatospora indigofera TaxID=67307 RepID=UPI0033B84565
MTDPRRGFSDLARYVKDAEAAGEQEIAAFFRAVLREDTARRRRRREDLAGAGAVTGNETTAPGPWNKRPAAAPAYPEA